jgi:hypothetical protein
MAGETSHRIHPDIIGSIEVDAAAERIRVNLKSPYYLQGKKLPTGTIQVIADGMYQNRINYSDWFRITFVGSG